MSLTVLQGEDDLDQFLAQHRRAMEEGRERESEIRESIARELGHSQ